MTKFLAKLTAIALGWQAVTFTVFTIGSWVNYLVSN